MVMIWIGISNYVNLFPQKKNASGKPFSRNLSRCPFLSVFIRFSRTNF